MGNFNGVITIFSPPSIKWIAYFGLEHNLNHQGRRVFTECLVFSTTLLNSYPRVTSFDALKQSADICAHRITFSSRKFIILNKLSCFQSKHTFWEVRTSFLFKILLSTSVRVHHYFDRHQFRRLSLAVEENDFLTVAQCSQGVLCIVQERPKVIRSS